MVRQITVGLVNQVNLMRNLPIRIFILIWGASMVMFWSYSFSSRA